MTYWIFSNQTDADAAQLICAESIGPDRLADGTIAPVQITKNWADVQQLTDGRFAFMAMPGEALPSGATGIDDISSLLPPAPLMDNNTDTNGQPV